MNRAAVVAALLFGLTAQVSAAECPFRSAAGGSLDFIFSGQSTQLQVTLPNKPPEVCTWTPGDESSSDIVCPSGLNETVSTGKTEDELVLLDVTYVKTCQAQ